MDLGDARVTVTTQFTAALQSDEKIEPVSKRVLEQAFFYQVVILLAI